MCSILAHVHTDSFQSPCCARMLYLCIMLLPRCPESALVFLLCRCLAQFISYLVFSGSQTGISEFGVGLQGLIDAGHVGHILGLPWCDQGWGSVGHRLMVDTQVLENKTPIKSIMHPFVSTHFCNFPKLFEKDFLKELTKLHNDFIEQIWY